MTTELVARAKAGDRRAIGELLELARPAILRALLGFRMPDADRDDLVQVVSLQVLTKLETFEENASISTWVHRITCNQAVTFLRTRARRRELDAVSSHDEDSGADFVLPARTAAPDAALIDAEDACRLHAAIAELPPKMRTAFEAVYGDETPMDEVAHSLGVDPTTVRTRLHRARQLVRDTLGHR